MAPKRAITVWSLQLGRGVSPSLSGLAGCPLISSLRRSNLGPDLCMLHKQSNSPDISLPFSVNSLVVFSPDSNPTGSRVKEKAPKCVGWSWWLMLTQNLLCEWQVSCYMFYTHSFLHSSTPYGGGIVTSLHCIGFGLKRLKEGSC
jgi:hypothetical protein